jgi:hypothetical protein
LTAWFGGAAGVTVHASFELQMMFLELEKGAVVAE